MTTRIRPNTTDLLNQSWREYAACQYAKDPEIFFAGDYDQRTVDAKTFCLTCPVLQQCQEWALNSDDSGVAGGMTETERHQHRNRRRRLPTITQPQHPTCGTNSGRWKHQQLNEKTCDPCRLAYNTYMRRRSVAKGKEPTSD